MIALDVNQDGRADLLITTVAGPLLLIGQAEGVPFRAAPLGPLAGLAGTSPLRPTTIDGPALLLGQNTFARDVFLGPKDQWQVRDQYDARRKAPAAGDNGFKFRQQHRANRPRILLLATKDQHALEDQARCLVEDVQASLGRAPLAGIQRIQQDCCLEGCELGLVPVVPLCRSFGGLPHGPQAVNPSWSILDWKEIHDRPQVFAGSNAQPFELRDFLWRQAVTVDVGTRDVASRHILIACLRLGQFEEDVRTGCEVDEARYSFSTTTGSAAASPSALCRQALEVEPEVLKVAGQCNDPASSLSIGVSDQQSVSCVGQCFVEVVEARFKWKLCEQRVPGGVTQLS